MNRILFIVLPLFIVCCLIATGCGGPNDRFPVSGTIMHNGAPLKSGAISFSPVDAKAIDTTAGSSIVNGKYSIAKKDGLKPGEYKVRVFGQVRTEDTRDMGPGHGVRAITMDIIPVRYNLKTTLKETVEAKKNKFDFTFTIDPSEFVEHPF